MVCVRRPPTLNKAESDVAFRYVLNVEAFTVDSIACFENFKHVGTCGRLSEVRLFTYALSCNISARYCMADEKGLRCHRKYLYAIPSRPINCNWIYIVVDDRCSVHRPIPGRNVVSRNARLLINIGTGTFAVCTSRKQNFHCTD